MHVCPKCRLCISSQSHTPCNVDAVEVEPAELTGELSIKFSQTEPFAQGSTGTLYQATHTPSGRRGILKIVPEVNLGSTNDRVRAKRELRKQTTLPPLALAPVLDGGELGSSLWLFREYVEGQSLAAHIAERGALPVQDAMSIMAQVAIGLDQLHRNGLLHRDLKPSHIILTADESEGPQIKLIDAGLAGKMADDGVMNVQGTAEYLSPEQASGKPVSFRSDLYALGCVFYEALMGTPPFAGEAAAILAAHRESLAPEVTVELPDAVKDLLRSMLDKEPRRRPFSAQQIRRTLEPLLARPLPAAVLAAPGPSGAASLRPASPIRRPAPPPAIAATKDTGRNTEMLDTGEIEALVIKEPVERQTEVLTSQEVNSLQVIDGAKAELDNQTEVISSEELDGLEIQEPADAGHVASIAPGQGVSSVPPAVPGSVAAQNSAPIAAGSHGWVDSTKNQAPRPVDEDMYDSLRPPAQAGGGQGLSSEHVSPSSPPRRAVNFDVESLFAGDSSPPDTTADEGFEDVAPTRVMQRGEPGYLPEQANIPGGPEEHRRKGIAVPSWAYVAAPVLLAALWLMFSGGDEASEETVASSAEPARQQEAAPIEKAPAEKAEGKGSAQHAAEDSQEPKQDEQANAKAAEDEAQAEEQADQAEEEATAEEQASQQEQADNAQANDSEDSTDDSANSAAPRARKRKITPVKAKLKQAGPSASDLKEQARAAYAAKKFADAAKLYGQVTKMSPRDAGAFAGLGASQLASGNKKGAVASYQRAVQLKPKTSGFHAALGRAYLENGDKARSIASYKKALELNPQNGAAKAALARLQ